jgi:hypothetical protein
MPGELEMGMGDEVVVVGKGEREIRMQYLGLFGPGTPGETAR